MWVWPGKKTAGALAHSAGHSGQSRRSGERRWGKRNDPRCAVLAHRGPPWLSLIDRSQTDESIHRKGMIAPLRQAAPGRLRIHPAKSEKSASPRSRGCMQKSIVRRDEFPVMIGRLTRRRGGRDVPGIGPGMGCVATGPSRSFSQTSARDPVVERATDPGAGDEQAPLLMSLSTHPSWARSLCPEGLCRRPVRCRAGRPARNSRRTRNRRRCTRSPETP